jgi:hypothetical protein
MASANLSASFSGLSLVARLLNRDLLRDVAVKVEGSTAAQKCPPSRVQKGPGILDALSINLSAHVFVDVIHSRVGITGGDSWRVRVCLPWMWIAA